MKTEREKHLTAIAFARWFACVGATVCAVHELGWWTGMGLGFALYSLQRQVGP